MQQIVELSPTAEQSHIIDQIRTTDDNLMVVALAGTGKTTTLEMIQAASPKKPVLCLAFNKKIAEEMKSRFNSSCAVHTFNGLGHRIWQKANAKNLTLNPKKSQELFKTLVDGLTKAERGEAWSCYWEVINAIAQAKSLGYIPTGKFPNAKRLIDSNAFYRSLDEQPSEATKDLTETLLTESIKASYDGYIDYNDQIYMPALFGGTFPRFPHVLVDEAQDLSPTNHAMLDKLVKGRLSIVGDPWQSIYGFRGAVQQGMDMLRDRFRMKPLDLTISFRCPKRIVENVHWHVPKMRWNREGGKVERLRDLDHRSVTDGAAIICRNNAPLFRLAFDLLSRGRSVSVAGSDIGPKVINT